MGGDRARRRPHVHFAAEAERTDHFKYTVRSRRHACADWRSRAQDRAEWHSFFANFAAAQMSMLSATFEVVCSETGGR